MKEVIKESLPLTEAVFYILISLYRPLHGYGIMQNVEKLSGGRVMLGAGTLYGAINTLLKKDWIAKAAGGSEEDSRKKEYIITVLGKEVVAAELLRLEEMINNGKAVQEVEQNE